MKIIVTGGLGHIGSHLIRDLPFLFTNVEMVIIDNLLTQRYPSLYNLPDGVHYRFIEGDVTTMELVPIFQGANVVIHLAAITDATRSFERREEVESVNLTATSQVADACVKTKVPMVLASSTSVYGTQNQQVDENCSADELKPQSPYAETKLREEALISEKCINESLKAIIFRYGTIFGISPGMRFHTAVNKFCWQAVMGIPLTVWKTAYEQKRPYLELNDAVNAIAFVIKSQLFDGRVYNVVSVNSTVRDVVEEIRQHIPTLRVNFVESKIMNQLSYEVLNSRMLEVGFKPKGNLGQGIAETIGLLKNASFSNDC